MVEFSVMQKHVDKLIANKSLHWWLGFIGLLLIANLVNHFNDITVKDFSHQLEEKLHAKEHEVSNSLNSYYAYLKEHPSSELFQVIQEQNEKIFNDKGIVYLVYENDSLIFWSNNSAGVENHLKEVCLDNNFVKLKNGYYQIIHHSANNNNKKQLLGLILIKNEYNYQNKYLNNLFFPDYGLPEGTEINLKITHGSGTIKNKEGIPLFDISLAPVHYRKGYLTYVSIVCYCFALLFLFFALENLYFQLLRSFHPIIPLLVLFVSIIGIRAIIVLKRLPAIIYETGLYNPSIFGNAGSFWFSFLGDVFIHSCLFLYAGFLLQKKLHSFPGVKKYTQFYSIFSLVIVYSLGTLVNIVINSLIHNSNISFTVTNFFGLSGYSFIGFLSISLLFFTFYIVTEKVVSLINPLRQSKTSFLIIFASSTLIHFLLCIQLHQQDWLQICWPIIISSLLYFFQQRKIIHALTNGIIFVAIFSSIATDIFTKNEDRKEFDSRKIYAEKLANQRDAVAENLFAEISKKIKSDSKLKNLLLKHPVNSIELEQRLRQVYFSGYWEHFQVNVSVVDSMCLPLIKTNNPLHENNTYFDEQINSNGLKTICPELFYIENIKEHARYVARIPISVKAITNKKPYLLYVEIEPKLSPDNIGYPELLLDKSVKTNHPLSDYSYAVYKNKQLIQCYGKYAYSLHFTFTEPTKEFSELSSNKFLHLFYKFDDQTLVVVSKEQQVFWDKFTTNSYFFMFFSLILIIYLYFREWRARKKLLNTSLHLRIQLLLVSVVIISLISFGVGTFVFITKQSGTKNTLALEEKIKSVLSELQSSLGSNDVLQANYKEYSVYILKKISVIFSADINMFDLQGNLYASSQPRLFEEGIISRKMNPLAFNHVISGNYSNLVIKENIGELNYYSAYQPFYNKEGKLLAYVNLPYFAKQNELEKEISIYLVALINIYVILFTFSIIAALFISNLVTRPLRVIQQRLSMLTFGRKNEPINWVEKDEIGSLVNEYNGMIAQLEESAQKLAKSERENAWREMAKQVAHEIKNPLTPMKLSIQHLQRTIETNPEDLKDRITKLSSMLIEQIDTLSHIANEFSAFAKMPKALLEKLNIFYILQSTTELFRETGNTKLLLVNELNGAVFIMADKDQTVRVFTNLIKNALQAIPDNVSGFVEVKLSLNNKNVVICIKDNGIGISSEVKDKIFTPNFSTKTDGMGLGLAMVKSIVQSIGGNIWFEPNIPSGTIFFVSLPVI